MDEAGVDMHLLSVTIPGVQMFDAASANVHAATANDRLAEAVRRRPTRLAGLACFGPQAPKAAAREMERVLVSGGRVALSNWDAAERSPFFAAVMGAVAAAEVPTPTEAPAGPSFFQFTDDLAFRALLEDAGFDSVAVDSIPTEISVASADELITALAQGTVRIGAALRAADDAQRNDMRDALEERLGEWRRGSGFVLPSPMKLASGTKPA